MLIGLTNKKNKRSAHDWTPYSVLTLVQEIANRVYFAQKIELVGQVEPHELAEIAELRRDCTYVDIKKERFAVQGVREGKQNKFPGEMSRNGPAHAWAGIFGISLSRNSRDICWHASAWA